jgi:hypothetical protein
MYIFSVYVPYGYMAQINPLPTDIQNVLHLFFFISLD